MKHPRLSVRRQDAGSCEAVLLPFRRDADGRLCEDRSSAPLVVPLAMLGCKVEVREVSRSAVRCVSEDVFEMVRLEHLCGGEQLRSLYVTDDMFAASKMVSNVDFEEMKVCGIESKPLPYGSFLLFS